MMINKFCARHSDDACFDRTFCHAAEFSLVSFELRPRVV